MKKRLIEFLAHLGIGQLRFEENVRLSRGFVNKVGDSIRVNNLNKISERYPELNINWLMTGEGNMIIDNKEPISRASEPVPEYKKPDTRPRIPLNAVAGSISVALSGVTSEDAEGFPLIQAFSNYNYTILVKGDSMEPEFHSGDELACLQLSQTKFIQWGRYHVLDTAQGILLKRIYDNGDYILCKSENNELYSDFKIHKKEIYNIGLVIGVLRRY